MTEIAIVGTSSDEEKGLRIDFRVPEGESCSGIWIESEGDDHFVSFARTIYGKSPDVDIPVEDKPEGAEPELFRLFLPTIAPAIQSGGRASIIQLGPMDTKLLLELEFGPNGERYLAPNL